MPTIVHIAGKLGLILLLSALETVLLLAIGPVFYDGRAEVESLTIDIL